jgi:hypothetical protein
MNNSSASLDTHQRVQPHLSPSERLLWCGTPRTGLVLRPTDALTIPLSLIWCGFAVFWEGLALFGETDPEHAWEWFFRLWGLPFVIAGLYMVVGRFFYDAWKRKRTVYALTNQRVLIAVETPRRVTSLALATLGEVNLKERADGSGTIIFGPIFVSRRQPQPPRFEFVQDAQRVYELVRSAQKA